MNTQPPSANQEPPTAWDTQSQLISEFQALQTGGASKEELEIKADEINSNVASLVESGEVALEDAWSLSVGDNPHLDASEREDF